MAFVNCRTSRTVADFSDTPEGTPIYAIGYGEDCRHTVGFSRFVGLEGDGVVVRVRNKFNLLLPPHQLALTRREANAVIETAYATTDTTAPAGANRQDNP